jgi:hypothetical protein
MTRSLWQHAVLCSALIAGTSLSLHAQNATSGGDQQPQPDVQGRRGGPGGAGGRRGGGVRGTVTGVSGSSVMLKTEQGQAWTIISTDNTRVRRDGQPGTVGAIQAGDEVMAMGMPDADKHEVHALMLVDVSAAEVAKAKANLGKTYIVGRITAINDTQLTVMRTDRVAQVISLDETTSLHKGGRMSPETMAAAGLNLEALGGGGGTGMGGGQGAGGGRRAANADAPAANPGEAITLADVKVGDSVVGVGSVKGGSFVPTDLRVQERPAGGGGGRRGMGNGDAPPPQ